MYEIYATKNANILWSYVKTEMITITAPSGVAVSFGALALILLSGPCIVEAAKGPKISAGGSWGRCKPPRGPENFPVLWYQTLRNANFGHLTENKLCSNVFSEHLRTWQGNVTHKFGRVVALPIFYGQGWLWCLQAGYKYKLNATKCSFHGGLSE